MEHPGGAVAEVAQDIQKMTREISQIEESLLEGLPVSEGASKGQRLGLLVFKAVCQAITWMQVEFHINSFVLSEYGEGSAPILNPLQSAVCVLHVSHTIRKIMFDDLLYKTTTVVQESEQREKENAALTKSS